MQHRRHAGDPPTHQELQPSLVADRNSREEQAVQSCRASQTPPAPQKKVKNTTVGGGTQVVTLVFGDVSGSLQPAPGQRGGHVTAAREPKHTRLHRSHSKPSQHSLLYGNNNNNNNNSLNVPLTRNTKRTLNIILNILNIQYSI